ncbi:MAG: methyltransferase domain-containing protein [Leptolyngbyaceae cyanobacterium SU_3_3]|nr:methyltransferase domain-containing protein [Leptolyngbyaceae cyanobacterium SU_3_3]
MLKYEFIDPDCQLDSQDFKFVESFLSATGRTQLGWHYITDITWIYSQAKLWPRNLHILDAGGGHGPVQFLLAEMGFGVTNIDMALFEVPVAYNRRYHTKLEVLPSFTPTAYMDLLGGGKTKLVTQRIKKLIKSTSIYANWSTHKYVSTHDRWRSMSECTETPLGTLQWKIGNLCRMPEIADASFDAVVSLSAWEHIPYDILGAALSEIRRVLKPDSKWAVTTSATEKSETWWHEPSQSNCFSVTDLENIFAARRSSSQEPENILEKYRHCQYLKDNLADFYRKSGKYGMPWGVWDPTYIPVGFSE